MMSALLIAQLTHLARIEIPILVLLCVLVIFVGFHFKRAANSSEEIFPAGRKMTAWIAGLSFVSANLRSVALMGWAGSAYPCGILAGHCGMGAAPALILDLIGAGGWTHLKARIAHNVGNPSYTHVGRARALAYGLVQLPYGAWERFEHHAPTPFSTILTQPSAGGFC